MTSLVAIAPLTAHYVEPPPGIAQRLLFGNPVGMRLLGVLRRVAPNQLVAAAISSEGTLDAEAAKQRVQQVCADRDKVRFVVGVTMTASHAGERSAGYANDIAQFAAIDTLDLGDIVAPTLLVAGTHDREIPYADISRAAGEILTSELFVLDHGTHLAFYIHPDSAAAQQRALEYLERTDP